MSTTPHVVGFQSSSTRQGRAFEEAVVTWLRIADWDIVERHAKVDGVEVDIVATDPAGVRWWIECKGSWEGPARERGGRRGDTVKKAIAVAWYLHQQPDRCPYMLVASHLPAPQLIGGRMLRAAIDAGLFDDVRTIGLQ